MSTRRWMVVILAVLLIGVAVTLHRLPSIVRAVAVSRIEAMTQRPATIAALDLRLLTGRVRVHGLRLFERDGRTPFAEVERVDARVRLPSLLLGHLWIRDLVVTRPTVRVVRLSDADFNLSDLVRSSGDTRRRLDVTVDHFRLDGGTVTLEDQALPERRTWTSEHIEIDAHDLSTRRGDGRAVGSSVTAGAPVSVDIKTLRLYPVHLEAFVTLDGLDLTMARAYLPPTAPVTLGPGRATTSVRVALDAREGLHVDANTRLDDVTVLKRATGELMAVVPKMTTEIANFAYREGALRLTRLALDGTVSVRNPAARADRRLQPSTVRASASDLTWPATTPGGLEFVTTIPGGGTVALTGALRAPPAPSQLRMRLAGADLAPWTQFLPLAATISGVAEGDLRTDEPLAADRRRARDRRPERRCGLARRDARSRGPPRGVRHHGPRVRGRLAAPRALARAPRHEHPRRGIGAGHGTRRARPALHRGARRGQRRGTRALAAVSTHDRTGQRQRRSRSGHRRAGGRRPAGDATRDGRARQRRRA